MFEPLPVSNLIIELSGFLVARSVVQFRIELPDLSLASSRFMPCSKSNLTIEALPLFTTRIA